MSALSQAFTDHIWPALADTPAPQTVHWRGEGQLPSAFAVTDLAAASLATVGLAVAALREQVGHAPGALAVDRRLASFWFASSLRPRGWQVPPAWDPLAGDYPTRDGWIRLHTNAPAHRLAALSVLGAASERGELAPRVAQWAAAELEDSVVAAGGCAARMLSREQWQAHPQGQALASEPLVAHSVLTGLARRGWTPDPARPLRGLRVLDLTRVLAGPVASRCLAGLGAEVLRLDPPDWNEPALVPDVTLGKRCARLDLKSAAGREVFERLLGSADVLLHGYRADALERLGYDRERLDALAPGRIDVSLNAYGWSGPWRNRRGFDSLVQMSTGIAEAGSHWRGEPQPVPLPVQALDHATGYLLAAAVLRGLSQRLRDGHGQAYRLSLARTAQLLQAPAFAAQPGVALAEVSAEDLAPGIEETPWGPARRLQAPLQLAATPLHWERPACELGSAPASWAAPSQSAGR
ncbi:MAG: Acetyl-CoA:oxalate CoA-transferase [Pseudomonas citronellolis]|nr:MAG: Acetyl-CoA:oxalate CoA-transferase [Pseudomonas citronellolis]